MNLVVRFLCIFSLFSFFNNADQNVAKRNNNTVVNNKVKNTKKAVKKTVNKNDVYGKYYSKEFIDQLTEEIKRRVVEDLQKKSLLSKPGGEAEVINEDQGSFKISKSETAKEEAKAWDEINRETYNVKKGFIKFPGTDTYLRVYGFGMFVGVATKHQHASGYTADYSLFPDKIAPKGEEGLKKSKYDFNMLANESRLGFETFSKVKMGEYECPLKTLIEVDFSGGDNGSSALNKDYELYLRHAYISFGNFLMGKTTTIFADPAASAETVNGPTGSTFKRTLQVSYKFNPNADTLISVALEHHPFHMINLNGKAGTTYNPSTSDGTNKYHHGGSLPSFILVADRNFTKGHISGAIALRHIKVDSNDANSKSSSTVGVSGRISGSYNFYKDDSIFGLVTYGAAPGIYISDYKNTVLVDKDYNDGKIKKLNVLGITGGIRHFWTDLYKIRSTLAVGYVKVKNPDILKTGDGSLTAVDRANNTLPREIIKSLFSVTANIFASLAPRLNIGVEYSFGRVKLEDKRSANTNTFLFVTRLDF